MKKFISYVIVFVVGFATCAYVIHRFPPYQGGENIREAAFTPAAAPSPLSGKNDAKIVGGSLMAQIVERASQAVVNIDVEEQRDHMEGWWGGYDEAPQRKGQGTGFIFDANGYVLTNYHVVAGNNRIQVTLNNGKVYTGRVQGADRSNDLAVIKIDATNLPVVELGSSASLRPGDWVIAIGNPLGYTYTATAGIISALHRSLETPGSRGTLIQTDAAINPGNSGGPLIDMGGRVVGINRAIATPTGVSIGLGFAIPIDTAKKVLNDLITRGHPIRPYLGVETMPVNSRIQQMLELPDMNGVVIRPGPSTPADQAGMQTGDVIRKINNRQITSMDDFLEALHSQTIGATIPITVWREGREIVINVKLGQLPDQ
ncbi:MAG: trypsin-like peptidase domain-containing protein [Armatimonadetes bacterium]|nr:trypsin-like peptidase domain-containing protein [Armatimonadota bacterium]